MQPEKKMAAMLFRAVAIFSLFVTASAGNTQYSIGRCAIADFVKPAQQCTRTFYRDIRVNGSLVKQCGNRFVEFQQCLLDILRPCIKNAAHLPSIHLIDNSHESEIETNFLQFLGDENFWCKNGGIGMPTMHFPAGMQCHPVVAYLARQCSSYYIRKFKSNARDEVLCEQYNKAKTCNLRVVLQHCSFKPEFLKLMELLVELSSELQPFCPENDKDLNRNFVFLRQAQKCPPQAIADVAFVLDVTPQTTFRKFLTMKKTIARVAKRMNYGWDGIQIGVYEFDAHLRKYFRLGKYNSENLFLKKMAEMRRNSFPDAGDDRRLTGASLQTLSNEVFNKLSLSEVRSRPFHSGQRPHVPPVCVVFLSGPSNDSMISAIEALQDKGVHVVLVGHVEENQTELPKSSSTSSVVNIPSNLIHTTFNVNKLSSEIAEQICVSQISKQQESNPTESYFPPSKWQYIHDTWLLRHSRFDFSLLWDPQPIMSPKLPSKQPEESPTHEDFYIFFEDDYWDSIPTTFPQDDSIMDTPSTDVEYYWPWEGKLEEALYEDV